MTHPPLRPTRVGRSAQSMMGDDPAMNLFHPLPDDLTEEAFTELLRQDGVRIERIVSDGHASPEDFWYDQDEDEWVALLEGDAGIAFADGRQVHLTRGDLLSLPAHTRHRVTFTSRPAIWLAVFYSSRSSKRCRY